MSTRITKSMAEAAAAKVSDELYNDKIDVLTKELNVELDRLYKKYIPAPVIACVNEYKKYFNLTKSCAISVVSYKGGYPMIGGTLSFFVTRESRLLHVYEEDFKPLQAIYKKRYGLLERRKKFSNDIYNSLLNCRTINVVKKELPELLPYIDVPETKSLPVPVFDDLRKVLKTLKQDKNGKV